jgi:transcriptional regulator GlxA family with amidase domain
VRGPAKTVAPVTVRRAEEFMRGKAEDPLTLQTNAVGCSSRSLQVVFHSFRGTSPMAALGRIWLELAHQTPSASLEPKIAQKLLAQCGRSEERTYATQYSQEQNRCDYCDERDDPSPYADKMLFVRERSTSECLKSNK